MKDKINFWFHVRRIPRYLFHVSPASAAVILVMTLIFLIPVLLDLFHQWWR